MVRGKIGRFRVAGYLLGVVDADAERRDLEGIMDALVDPWLSWIAPHKISRAWWTGR